MRAFVANKIQVEALHWLLLPPDKYLFMEKHCASVAVTANSKAVMVIHLLHLALYILGI